MALSQTFRLDIGLQMIGKTNPNPINHRTSWLRFSSYFDELVNQICKYIFLRYIDLKKNTELSLENNFVNIYLQ